MRDHDRRFERFRNDARFATMVKSFEALLYSEQRITYDEILDAAFVAYVRYREMNPTLVMIENERKARHP